jgi:hypothetical protein
VRDRTAQVDPTIVPVSCRPTGTSTVTGILEHSGVRANAENFARTFGYTLYYGIGLLGLVFLGFLALPRDARIEHDEPVAEPALAGV